MAVIVDGNGVLKTERLPVLIDVYSLPQASGPGYYIKTVTALQDLTTLYSPLKGKVL